VAGTGVADVVVRPIFVEEVGRFNAELDAHHWLGHRLTGQVLRYVAELDGRWVAVVGFGSAALSCAARDRFIGWSREQQYARLIHVANNQRFCVLPGGRIPNLASAVLARVLRRISEDYLAVYGHRVLAVETFTDPTRHTGACYAAANFHRVGSTLGYARSAGRYHHHGNLKRVWLYPLHRDAAAILSAAFDHPLLTRKDTHVIDLNALPVSGPVGLRAVLDGLTDPRAKRGIRHSVPSTLTMVVAAGLSGCGRSFRSVGDFVADLPQDALERLGARWHPVRRRHIAPNEATIRRHVKMIDADEADALVGAWLLGLVHTGRLAADQAGALLAIALDGKTLKGSWEELRTSQVKLFSALVHGEGVIVGQRKVPEDTTEVTQVLPLLDDIGAARAAAGTGTAGDLSQIVFTADALHVHRDNIEQLTDRGGEYVLTVKGNQPTLERDIAALFPSPAGAADFPAHHTTFDRGHGRIEIRSIWCTSNVSGLDFPGVFQAFRIHRQTFDLCFNPIRKPETVHGITSLTAWQANPADVLAHNRGHWEVENREHYVRDRTFDEDRSQVRTGASPQFMATARNIAISLLRLAGCTNIARGLEHLSRRLDHVLALLGA